MCPQHARTFGRSRSMPQPNLAASPLLAIVTYTLGDTFTILSYHCRRHFDQAKRVAASEGSLI